MVFSNGRGLALCYDSPVRGSVFDSWYVASTQVAIRVREKEQKCRAGHTFMANICVKLSTHFCSDRRPFASLAELVKEGKNGGCIAVEMVLQVHIPAVVLGCKYQSHLFMRGLEKVSRAFQVSRPAPHGQTRINSSHLTTCAVCVSRISGFRC